MALALAEAWAWLEAQGLIVPASDQGHGTSYRVLSRRARRFQSEAEFAKYAVARMLPREALHSNDLGVAILERRSKRQEIGDADLVRCGIASSDQSRLRGRWL